MSVSRGCSHFKEKEELFQRWNQQLLELEDNKKKFYCDRWKTDMNCDFKKRSNWLSRKMCNHFPNLTFSTGEVAGTKQDGVQALKEFWDTTPSTAKLRGRILIDKLLRRKSVTTWHKRLSKTGPDLQGFKKSMRDASGSQGMDQWQAEDLHLISHCEDALTMVWKAMQIWADCGLTPTILQHARYSFLPKATKIVNHCTSPAATRPIAVYSVWWRTWSSCYVQSSMVSALKPCFPTAMGALHGGGPLKQAAVCDVLLTSWRHGASLDFRQCFEMIDVPMLKQALLLGLPQHLHSWIEVTCNHWCNTFRWITYDRTAAEQPSRYSTGIPQGDSASPMLLALLLAPGCAQVESLAASDRLRLAVYMDDRTIISSSRELLEQAIQTWSDFAGRMHLLESPTKTQRCFLDDPTSSKCMDVLGTLIGEPTPQAFKTYMKHSKRFKAASHTAHRVGLLPVPQRKKMEAMAMHSRTQATYGWLTGNPPWQWARSYNATLWRSMGRFTAGVPEMKTIIGGAHLELQQATLLQQLHVLVHRDQALRDLNLFPLRGALDRLIEDQLIELGWYITPTGWEHTVLDHSFKLVDILNKTRWRKISHDLRQSFRWAAYERLRDSSRREFREVDLPPLSEERLDLVRRWGKQHFGRLPMLTGSIKSLRMRSIKSTTPLSCAKCGEIEPVWDHYWTCGMQQQPPADCLLRRFLWPRTAADFDTCSAFSSAIDKVRGQ
eukprot:Skav233935  [mRNA]  locus=scaffold2412:127198:129360:- [translate_table: standard]